MMDDLEDDHRDPMSGFQAFLDHQRRREEAEQNVLPHLLDILHLTSFTHPFILVKLLLTRHGTQLIIVCCDTQ